MHIRYLLRWLSDPKRVLQCQHNKSRQARNVEEKQKRERLAIKQVQLIAYFSMTFLYQIVNTSRFCIFSRLSRLVMLALLASETRLRHSVLYNLSSIIGLKIAQVRGHGVAPAISGPINWFRSSGPTEADPHHVPIYFHTFEIAQLANVRHGFIEHKCDFGT